MFMMRHDPKTVNFFGVSITKYMITPRGLLSCLPRGIIIRTEVRGTGVTQKAGKDERTYKGKKR